MKLTAILTALSLCLFSVSCLKKDSYNCNYDACSAVVPASEITQVESYLSANNITNAVKHCSGMYYRITDPGTGAATDQCSIVSVLYKGMLPNGTVFDQAATTPYVDYLSNLVRGWQNGVPLVKTGGKITLYIPPSLGYGAAGAPGRNPGDPPVIPPNSVIIFDITLVATAR